MIEHSCNVYKLPIYKGPPTHICALCDSKEIEDADIVDCKFWLCDACKKALIRLVEHEKLCMRRERIMKQIEEGEIE